MAPGLPEIAIKYSITNATVVALTLSIFLLSLAITVRHFFVEPKAYSNVPLSLSFLDLCPKCMGGPGYCIYPISLRWGSIWHVHSLHRRGL